MAFGGVIKLQGEAEYRAALKKITDELKVVGTELSKVSSQFGKNEKSVDSLTAKNKVLTDKLNEQQKALNLTKEMLDKAKEEYDKSVKSVEDLKDELNKAQTALDKATSSTEATAEEVQQLESDVNELKNKLSAAEKETGAYETTVKKWTAEVNKAETAVNNTTREINDNKAAIDKLGKETDQTADDIDDLSDSMEKASKKTDKLTDNLDELKNETKKTGDGFTVFKGVLADLVSNGINFCINGVRNLIGEAISASDSLAKFEQTMNFAGFDDKAIKEASDKVKEYADKTVYDLNTISNTTAQLAANGIKDYVGLTQAAGNLNAVAGGNADTFNSVAMALSQTAGAGKLTTENWNQLANSIPGASGKLMEALKEAGAYTGDFREAMSKGEITAEEFNAAIMKLGNEPVAVEAASSVKTFEGAIGNMQATVVTGLQEIISEIGVENITGFLTKLTTLITKVITVVSGAVKFIKNNLPATLVLVTGLLTAFTAQVIANKVAVIAATAAEKGMTVAQYAAATAQKALNLAMAANPIGLIIAGITALVAAFMLLWNNCEGFREFWKNLWDKITKTFSEFIDAFKIGWGIITDFVQTALTNIGNFFKGAWEGIRAIWNTVVAFFKGIFEGISNVFSGIKSMFTGFFGAAWEGVKGIWNAAAGFFQGVWSGISSAFNNVTNFFSSTFRNAWEGVKKVFSTVKTFFTGIKNAIVGAFQAIPEALANIFKEALKKIKEVANKIGDTVSGVVNKIPGVSTVKSIGSKIKGFFAGGGTLSQNGDMAIVGEAGPEMLQLKNGKAIVTPFSGNNSGWVRQIAGDVKNNSNRIAIPAAQTVQNAADGVFSESKYNYIVSAFKDALMGVKVVMDADEMGRFVETTVADAIYT